MDDKRLRDLFGEIRRADRAHTPALDAVLARAGRNRHPIPVRRLTIAATGIAAAAALWLVDPESPPPLPVTSISTWRPTTDALLPPRDAGWLGGIPALSASLLDSFLPTVSDSAQRTLP